LAYDPTTNFCRYTDATVNHWHKLERPGVLLENGHVIALTFAVLDTPKETQEATTDTAARSSLSRSMALLWIAICKTLPIHLPVRRRTDSHEPIAKPVEKEHDPYPLDFLATGRTYQASIFSDTPGSRKATHTRQTVTSQTTIPIAMEPNGGHLMILDAHAVVSP
jgi:hypothetical protein